MVLFFFLAAAAAAAVLVKMDAVFVGADDEPVEGLALDGGFSSLAFFVGGATGRNEQ
jgi:hypothetical protein